MASRPALASMSPAWSMVIAACDCASIPSAEAPLTTMAFGVVSLDDVCAGADAMEIDTVDARVRRDVGGDIVDVECRVTGWNPYTAIDHAGRGGAADRAGAGESRHGSDTVGLRGAGRRQQQGAGRDRAEQRGAPAGTLREGCDRVRARARVHAVIIDAEATLDGGADGVCLGLPQPDMAGFRPALPIAAPRHSSPPARCLIYVSLVN